jgi:hypothetical protein
MAWIGPFKLCDYLDRPGAVPDSELPEEVPGVYALTERPGPASRTLRMIHFMLGEAVFCEDESAI